MPPRKKKQALETKDALSLNGCDDSLNLQDSSNKFGNNQDDVDQSDVATAAAADEELQPPKKIRKKNKNKDVSDAKPSAKAKN